MTVPTAVISLHASEVEMRVTFITPPGRFPTVVYDPGPWWDAVAEDREHDLNRFDLNYWWWRTLCSVPAAAALARASHAQGWPRVVQTIWNFQASARAASSAFRALSVRDTFRSIDSYLLAVSGIVSHIELLNGSQGDMCISLEVGPTVSLLNYHTSAELVRYAKKQSLLAKTIGSALKEYHERLEFVAFKVKSEIELLTAMIAAKVIHASYPAAHVSLIDHGYENYSLQPHIDALRKTGALEQVFDTIVVAKDDIDIVVPALVNMCATGRAPMGFLTTEDMPALVRRAPRPQEPQSVPTFSPEPIYQMRLSQRRCYWSRCTFCAQNSKYDDPRVPDKKEVHKSIDRIEAVTAAGYHNIIFSDEALSPATLRILSAEICRRGLDLHWACRCKLERSFSRELLAQMRGSGCYEILFGLETTSPVLLRRMDKFVEGLDEDGIARIFREMSQLGIGIHVNLICGFPGETLAEAEATIEFVIKCLERHRNASFRLNRFALFPATPVARDPSAFGLSEIFAIGDMPPEYCYRFNSETGAQTEPVMQQFERLSRELEERLGWGALVAKPHGRAVLDLYFSSGHGGHLKAQPDNPLERLRQAVAYERITAQS
jgi:Radical SAM superfamily